MTHDASEGSDHRQSVGRRGESLAAAFLQTKGFKIRERNWRCRFGEIDLIVERNGEVRFVEVKTRETTMFGYPEESITRTKRLHMSRAIEVWLAKSPHPPTSFQADAVVILVERGKAPDIRWIEGI